MYFCVLYNSSVTINDFGFFYAALGVFFYENDATARKHFCLFGRTSMHVTPMLVIVFLIWPIVNNKQQ
jgi:hypothetical protein